MQILIHMLVQKKQNKGLRVSNLDFIPQLSEHAWQWKG